MMKITPSTMRIVPDEKYPDMYRVQWPDGDVSVRTPNPEYKGGHYGFYNKTRAKEHLHRTGIENYTKGLTYKASVAQ